MVRIGSQSESAVDTDAERVLCQGALTREFKTYYSTNRVANNGTTRPAAIWNTRANVTSSSGALCVVIFTR